MPKPVVTIHAGAGKTGSTAIQQWAKKNRSVLERKGIVYTGLFFEETTIPRPEQRPAEIFANALRRGTESLIESIRQGLQQASGESLSHILWSNEGIFESVSTIGPALKQICQEYDSRLVIYLRRQDDWFVSAYKQWGIKHKTYPGPVIDFETWYQSNKARGDYARILGLWEEVLPRNRISVLIYEPGESVLSSFASKMGLDISDFATDDLRPNAAPDATVLSLFKLFNSQFEGEVFPDVLGSFLHRTGIFATRFKDVSPGVSVPDASQRSVMMRDFEDCNRKLMRYVSESDLESWHSTPTPETEQDCDTGAEQLIAALLHAAVAMDKRIVNLENQIKEIRNSMLSQNR